MVWGIYQRNISFGGDSDTPTFFTEAPPWSIDISNTAFISRPRDFQPTLRSYAIWVTAASNVTMTGVNVTGFPSRSRSDANVVRLDMYAPFYRPSSVRIEGCMITDNDGEECRILMDLATSPLVQGGCR